MILGGALGLGIWYRQQFRGRLIALRHLQEIMEMLISEVRYSKATLPECCRHVAERVEEPFRGCLKNVYEEMRDNTGRGFGEIFAEQMRTGLSALPIRPADGEVFLRFALQNSFAEGDMQIKWMEQSREQLTHTVETLEAELAGKSRIALSLGAMSGLLLVILLL